MNIFVQGFMWTNVFNSFGKIPRNAIAVLFGKNMFGFIRNHQIVSQSGCTILYSHQKWVRVSDAPHLHQQNLLFLMLSVFQVLAILIGV